MITASEIYWILKLDDIRVMLFVFIGCFGIFAFISVAGWGIHAEFHNDTADSCKKGFFYSACLALLLAIPATMLPSTKQMATIKVIPMIANSQAIQTMSNDAKEIYTLGIKAIKEQLTGKEQGK